jgi:hypothetical protein
MEAYLLSVGAQKDSLEECMTCPQQWYEDVFVVIFANACIQFFLLCQTMKEVIFFGHVLGNLGAPALRVQNKQVAAGQRLHCTVKPHPDFTKFKLN